jgi:D-glycero-D-manno-heptose 1,7-bisphosphate phosphatase
MEEYAKACGCRKPLPGMLMEAAKKYSIDLASSYMIGDKLTDVEAALAAGCRPVLVTTGYGEDESSAAPVQVPRYESLLEAARAIVDSLAEAGGKDN